MTKTTHDAVNHPSHYTQYPVEVIELTRHMNFCKGNAVKYVARAGYKGGPEKELEDLDKAIWYLKDEREQVAQKLALQKEASNTTGGSFIVDGDIQPAKLANVSFAVHPSTGIAEEEVAKIVANELSYKYKLARG